MKPILLSLVLALASTNFLHAQIGNTCGDPILVTALPYTTTDDTANYGDDVSGSPGASCGSNRGYLDGDDVFYSWTAASTGTFDISLTGISDTYTGLFIYSDCAAVGATCLDGDFNSSSIANLEILGFSTTMGTTYIIAISTWATPQSTAYTLNIAPPPPAPANDECIDAVTLVCNGPAIDGTTVSASDNADGVGCTQGPSVWYSFVGTGLPVTLVMAPDFDAKIGIATGTCGAFVNVACEDQSTATETITFTPADGVTHFVTVGHFSNTSTTTGTFTLELTCETCTNPAASYTVTDDCANDQFSVAVEITDMGTATSLTISDDQVPATQTANMAGTYTFGPYAAGTSVVFTSTNDQDGTCLITSPAQVAGCPPANNLCSAATALVCNAAAINGSTVNATDNADDVGCGQGPSVWYSFVGAGLPVSITADPDNASYDIELAVATGDCAGGFTNVSCTDGFDDETISFTPDNGVTYYVTVGHYNNTNTSTGTFTIELECATCIQPEASLSVAAGCNASGLFEATINVTSLGNATSVTVSDGTAPTVITEIGEVNFTYSPGAGTVNFTVASNQDASCTINGDLDIPASCPPANVICANAEVLTINPAGNCPAGGVSIDLTGVFNAPDDVLSCDNAGNYLVYYTFTAPSNGSLTFDAATGTNPPAGLEVFSGDCNALVSVECLNNLDGTIDGLTPNQVYYAIIWSDTQSSTIDFCIEAEAAPPANDACADAIALTDANGVPTAASGATYNTATANPAESTSAVACNGFTGNTDDDIWFTVTAPNGAGDVITVIADGTPDVSVQKVMGKKGKSDREKLTCVRWMISYAK
jgi:hypothetical protein